LWYWSYDSWGVCPSSWDTTRYIDTLVFIGSWIVRSHDIIIWSRYLISDIITRSCRGISSTSTRIESDIIARSSGCREPRDMSRNCPDLIVL
jgi:hypothetical protein